MLTLVGKPGCHLCDEARVIVAPVLDELALFDLYWEKIPVVLIAGVVHDYWRVDPDRLRAALSR